MAERAAVQREVGLEEISGGVVRLAGDRWVAVLEVGGVNFGFQSDAEREATLAGFTAWLNSLSADVQLLVRVLPVDMAARVRELERRARGELVGALLAVHLDYLAFLEGLAQARTLLERRFYVAIAVEPGRARRRGDHAWRSLRALAGRSGHASPAADRVAAGKHLTARCDDVGRELARCGVAARRLEDEELYALWCSYWQPERSRQQRLRREFRDYAALVVLAAGRTAPAGV